MLVGCVPAVGSSSGQLCHEVISICFMLHNVQLQLSQGLLSLHRMVDMFYGHAHTPAPHFLTFSMRVLANAAKV